MGEKNTAAGNVPNLQSFAQALAFLAVEAHRLGQAPLAGALEAALQDLLGRPLTPPKAKT